MKRYLWQLSFDCGRNGCVEGLFVATEEEIKKATNYNVNFGEALGKYSDIHGKLEETDIKKMDLDSETVEKVTKILGETWNGYNPLHYINDIDYLLDKLHSDYEIRQLATKMKIDISKCNSTDDILDLISDNADEFDFEYLEDMVDEIKKGE